jgi:actin-related protein
MFPGLADRLKRNLRESLPYDYCRAAVVASPDRADASWIGGSILASISWFPEMCISGEEYAEYGASVVRWKCLH